jgi:membrane protein
MLAHASKWAFGLYVSRAMPYMKVYGAIGLVPLFLFWLYLNWLIVLFGLELAFTLQGMRGRAFEEHDRDTGLAVSDPQWLIPLMATVARRFGNGVTVSRQDLAEELRLRLDSVAELADRLEDEGLLLQVSRRGSEDVGLTLALPPERIPLSRLVDLGARLTVGSDERSGPGWAFLGTLRDSARHAAGERTLADVLSDAGAAARAGSSS